MPVCQGQTAGKGQQGADVLSVFAHSQGFPQLGFREESFMPLQLPPKCWGLSLVKWLGRMKGMNYMGFSSPCQNNFSFQGTIFLDVGLDALCRGEMFLVTHGFPSNCSTPRGACGQCTWEYITALVSREKELPPLVLLDKRLDQSSLQTPDNLLQELSWKSQRGNIPVC